jgi:hypothetical protein
MNEHVNHRSHTQEDQPVPPGSEIRPVTPPSEPIVGSKRDPRIALAVSALALLLIGVGVLWFDYQLVRLVVWLLA